MSLAGIKSGTPLADGQNPPVFRKTIQEPEPVSWAYRAALIAVAGGVMALPAIYLMLVGALAYAVYFHFTRDYRWLMQDGSSIWSSVLYVGLVLIGLILIFFLLRPLFVRRALFEFVQKICRLVGAPQPSRIFIDWTPNAAASFAPGGRGFWRGELEMTIGLPIIARLTIAQCGGVIAHELGHFSQAAGMRLGLLIRRLNDWFGRVAFQPAIVEQRMSQGMRFAGLYGRLILLGTLAALWITRRLLHLFLLLGHAMSCYSLRQLEFDADLCEARVAGRENFNAVARGLRHLNDGFERAMVLLQRGAIHQRYARNFLALIEARTDVAAAYEVWLLDFGKPRRTRWFDTHPADAERSARVSRFKGEPVLADARPARMLLADFDGLSRLVSEDFYRHIALPLENFAPLELDEFCAGEALSPNECADVNRFFANRASPERPIPIDIAMLLAPESEAPLASDLSARWNEVWAETEPQFAEFLAERRRRFDALRARTLREARHGFERLIRFSRTAAERANEAQLDSATSAMDAADRSLAPFEQMALERLADALRGVADETERARAVTAAERIAQLRNVWKEFPHLQERLFCLGQTFTIARVNRPESKASRLRLDLAQDLSRKLKELAAELQIEDPMHAGETIAGVISRRLPNGKVRLEEAAVVQAREYLSYLQALYFHLMAQLCSVAAAAETGRR
jgi:Zn-dependent protease with chaperone function